LELVEGVGPPQEDDVERGPVGGHRGLLDALRGDDVDALHLGAGGRDLVHALHGHELIDGVDQARAGEQGVGVLLLELVREVDDVIDRLVAPGMVGVDPHGDLVVGARGGLQLLDVLDGLRVWVHPLDGVGLKGELALDGDAREQDHHTDDGQRHGGALRKAAEEDRHPA
jgi:hypothetical protein